jgi:hypothetical protein
MSNGPCVQLIQHHTMKTKEGIELNSYLHAFLNPEMDRDE